MPDNVNKVGQRTKTESNVHTFQRRVTMQVAKYVGVHRAQLQTGHLS